MSTVGLGAAVAGAVAVAMLATRVAPRPPGGRLPDVPDAPGWRPGPRFVRRTGPPGDDAVAAWCEVVARSLRSGSSLTAAVVATATMDSPMSQVVGPVAQRVGRGESLLDALDRAAVDPTTAVGLAFAVLRSCARFGGPAATPLERAAATLRAREAVAAEQHAQSAQARLSARVLTLVPIALLVLLAASDPKVRAAITTPAGAAVVLLGGLLNGAGALWMRRIIGSPR